MIVIIPRVEYQCLSGPLVTSKCIQVQMTSEFADLCLKVSSFQLLHHYYKNIRVTHYLDKQCYSDTPM